MNKKGATAFLKLIMKDDVVPELLAKDATIVEKFGRVWKWRDGFLEAVAVAEKINAEAVRKGKPLGNQELMGLIQKAVNGATKIELTSALAVELAQNTSMWKKGMKAAGFALRNGLRIVGIVGAVAGALNTVTQGYADDGVVGIGKQWCKDIVMYEWTDPLLQGATTSWAGWLYSWFNFNENGALRRMRLNNVANGTEGGRAQ